MTLARLREATQADSKNLLTWANAKDSLKWKKKTEKRIDEWTHAEWLCSRISDPSCELWIIEIPLQKDIGQIRIDKHGSQVFIDVYLDQNHRGNGIAGWSLNKVIDLYYAAHNCRSFHALVHRENCASLKLFMRNGFIYQTDEFGDWFTLIKTITIGEE